MICIAPMSPLTKLHRQLLTPPYRALPWAVFVYFVGCFLLHPNSPLRTGLLADPDDYMRLVQVMNWLQGPMNFSSWFDVSQPRLSPGANTIVHWSRLVDLPIALLAWPLIKFLGLRSAVLAAAMIVPVCLFGLAIMLTTRLAQPFAGKDNARLASLFLLTAPLTLFNYTPGRVDHHGWQVLIAGFGLYALPRILASTEGWRYAVYAATTFACGLWIGTEAVPWVLLFTACLSLSAAWQGGVAQRNAAIFGIALTFATALVTLLAVAPQDYGSRALSWYSPAFMIFAGLTAAVLSSAAYLGRLADRRTLRIAMLIAFGLCGLILFVLLVPSISAGPFADYDEFNSNTALHNINEAQPFYKALRINFYNPLSWRGASINFIALVFLPLLALAHACWRLRQQDPQWRAVLFHTLFLLAALLLTLFYQVRVGWFLQFIAIAPLAGLLVEGWTRISTRWRGRPRFWAEIGWLLLLGTVPVILVPAIYHDSKLVSEVLLFPATRNPKTCAPKLVADFLANDPRFANGTHTIIASANDGPELLFRTRFNVLAGNFNVPGNIDVYRFFRSRDDGAAQDIMAYWNADLVLTCKLLSPFYAGYNEAIFGKTLFLKKNSDGTLGLGGDPRHPTLAEQLVSGHPPHWLKPVEISPDSDYLLFEHNVSANDR